MLLVRVQGCGSSGKINTAQERAVLPGDSAAGGYILYTQSIPSAQHGVVFGRHGFVPSPLRRRSRGTKFRQPTVT